MFTILICDDEKIFTDFLSQKLRDIIIKGRYSDFEYNIIIKNDPSEAVGFCINNIVDIAFLDIDMPGINGFDIATVLNSKLKNVKLIFISNFDNFVYTSLKFKPFRFIRKSVVDNELKEAIESSLNEILIYNGFLILGNKYLNEKIFYSDILYIESKGNYVEIVTVNGQRYLHRTTLGDLYDDLYNYDFVRIHSGFVVPMSKIKFVRSNIVELQNGLQLKISRKYNNYLKEKFYKYLRR
ncbi:MAG: response regulator transcription factor [Bacilli bacterium]|nr:response regulator transcription factor [Bacilli bacterium]